MKQVIITLLLLLPIARFSIGKQMDSSLAKSVGINFLLNQINSTNWNHGIKLELAYTSSSKATFDSKNKNINNYFYIFNVNQDKGFVIVSADDIVLPVLGYSLENGFKPNGIPDHVKSWLDGYSQQIKNAIDNHVFATPEIIKKWDELKSGSLSQQKLGKKSNTMNYLIKTQWGQWPYYNDLCPYDNNVGRRVPSGCVATAMAQVIKYWDYPQKGIGKHSYTHSKYGTLSADFGSQYYNWFSMPNKVTSSADSIVSTLMYHCGVAIDMDYDENGSSGYPGRIPDAIINYFGFSKTAKWVYRSSTPDTQWISMLKKEFDSGRPVIYSGYPNATTTGHCFVGDGYDNNNLIHMNWGWDGYYDGFYSLKSLTPGPANYSNYTSVVIGIEPASGSQNLNLDITNNVTASQTELEYGSSFTISTNIKNKGASTFKGVYYAVLSDTNGKFIDYIDSFNETTGLAANSGYQKNIIFNYNSGYKLLPGNYIISIYQKPVGGYLRKIHAMNPSLQEQCKIKVMYHQFIELNSDMSQTPKFFINGASAALNVNLINKSSSTFVGQYRACLFKKDSSLAEIIDIKNETNGLSSQSTYKTPFIPFSKSSVTSPAGEYFVRIQFKEDTSSIWYTAGSRYFKNETKVVILESPKPDKYEVNNTQSQAYSLVPVFNNSKAHVNTDGSNCHKASDYDYYKVVLPAGNNYTIDGKLQDLYFSDSGNVYTLDAYFSYSNGGSSWSNPFNNILPNKIIAKGGETIYFVVYAGTFDQIGTYLLDIEINPASSSKNIKSFTVNGMTNVQIDSVKATILVKVDDLTDITSLTPNILISDFASINPGSGIIQDFSNPFVYKVTAQDNTIKNWIVTVLKQTGSVKINPSNTELINIMPNPAKDVLDVEFWGLEMQINQIRLMDINGLIIPVSLLKQNNLKYQLDLSGIKGGVYILEVNTNIGLLNKRLILTK